MSPLPPSPISPTQNLLNQPANSIQAPANNPLSEASETSLEELFSRDPYSWGFHKDIPTIVRELRAHKERVLAAEAAGKRAPKSTAPKKQMTLEDLL